MKPANRIIPKITEEEPTIEKFIGFDTFSPHADLQIGYFRGLQNYDIFGNYIKSRRGSVVLSTDICPDLDILNRVHFDSGSIEYVIIQQLNGGVSEFRFIELTSGGAWANVLLKTSLTPFTLATTERVDMIVSNGKIYIFSLVGNAILEYINPSLSPDIFFYARKMGIPAPQITTIAQDIGDLLGKRVYGVELVYKNTSVTPNVDIVSSGINRSLLTTNPLLGEGALAYTLDVDGQLFQITCSNILNDGTDIEAVENENWTHARLWRSKDLTTATNSVPDLNGDSEITGQPYEMFQVQEMTRAAFIAASFTFADDNVLDDNMPFPNDLVSEGRLELVPIPKAATGVFHRNRIWASGIVDMPSPDGLVEGTQIQSKIFYSPEVDTKYSESMNVLNYIESDPGDGQLMIRLISLEQDLIGIKEGKTGRVKNGDPDSKWEVTDHVIGIEKPQLAQFVPNVGICAIVNDQKDFRIFGFDLQWHSVFSGLQISRPIRNILKDADLSDLDFIYINGKLIVNLGNAEMLVLAVEQQKGWSKYTYPFNDLSEVIVTFNDGRRVAVINRGQPLLEIEKEIDTDYDVVTVENNPIETFLTTHKFQDMGGRALIEERFLSVMAVLDQNIEAQAYVNGKIWISPPFTFLLDPSEYPDIKLRETEYQAYEEFRAVGNYIHYDFSTTAPNTIYSIMLNCLIQRGSIRPGFDPFGLLADAIVMPPWANSTDDIEETGVALDTYEETGVATDTITET